MENVCNYIYLLMFSICSILGFVNLHVIIKLKRFFDNILWYWKGGGGTRKHLIFFKKETLAYEQQENDFCTSQNINGVLFH